MSKKTNHISINKLESTMQNNIVIIPMDGFPEIEITIRRILPLQDVLQFVEDVVSSCVDVETGQYIPEIRKFAVRASVLTRYANFTLPKDPEKQYDIIYNTNAFSQVLSHIDAEQYNEILYAIDERIRHNVTMIESAMVNQMSELTAKINSFISNSETMFGNIEGEDMSALMKNLANISSIDEGKMAKAVFDLRKQEMNDANGDSVVSSDGNVVTLRKKKD